MENIGSEYIENAVVELVELLGTKENIDSQHLLNLLHGGDIKGCIKNIALCLGLPIEINLSYVSDTDVNNSSGSYSNTSTQDAENRFESSDLVKTDYRGLGSQGIVAQVLIPRDIPFYGSNRLNGYPIKVKVSKNCADYPETLITVISHELSHILLATVGSIYKDNEIYTDLTPLILGFSDIVSRGRRTVKVTTDYGPVVTTTHTYTTNYGYLDDKQFNIASSKINKILEKNVLQKKALYINISRFENKQSLYEKYLKLFEDLVVYFHSHKNIPMNQGDSKLIISFFNESLFDEIESLNNKDITRIEKLKKFYSGLNHYTNHNVDILDKNTENTLSFIHSLENRIKQMKEDIKVLIKYLDLLNKIKANTKYFWYLV